MHDHGMQTEGTIYLQQKSVMDWIMTVMDWSMRILLRQVQTYNDEYVADQWKYVDEQIDG